MGTFSVVVMRGASVLTMAVVVRRGGTVFRAVGVWPEVVVPGLGVHAGGVVPGGPRLGSVGLDTVVAGGVGRLGAVGAWVVILFGGVATVVVVLVVVPGLPRVGGGSVVDLARVGGVDAVVVVRIGAVGAGVVVLRWNLRVGDVR